MNAYSPDELAILNHAARTGQSAAEVIGLLPGRSKASVANKISIIRHHGSEWKRKRDSGLDLDGDRRAQKDAKQGSAALEEKILVMFKRRASERRISLREAAATYLAPGLPK